MANADRLTGLDASFLALEKDGAHMHVGSVLVFEGPTPDYDAFVDHIERGLHLVPRYRQKLAFPPLGIGAADVGRRPALQRELPHPPHRAAAAGGRDELRRLAAASSPSSSTARSRCGRSGSSTASPTAASR